MFKFKQKRKTNNNRIKRMTVIGIILLFLAGMVFASLILRKEAKADWYNDNWHYRKMYTVDPTKVSGSADLTDFPVLISTTDTDLINKVQSDGDDIVFTDSNGSKLDHEIEKINSATGEIVAWVKIPTLYTAASTVIYMYYGNPSVNNQQNAAGVWSNNYVSVYHLDETSGTRSDSKAVNNLTDDNTVASNTGKIGTGADFENLPTDGNERLTITNANQTGLNITGNITIETWVKLETTGTTQSLVTKDDSIPQAGYTLRYNSIGQMNFQVSNDGTNSTLVASTGLTISTGTWYHVVGVYDGTYLRMYYNGSQNNQNAYSSGIYNSTAPFSLGSRATTSAVELDGMLDEVRVSNVARSADWINTTYANQNSPGTFFSTVGSEEKALSPILFYNFDDASGQTVNDFSNNIPALLGSATYSETSDPTRKRDNCYSEGCLFFDGTDDVLTATNSAGIDLNQGLASGFSITSWIKVNSDGENNVGQIFSKGTNTYLRVTNEGTDGKADLEAKLDLGTTDATILATDAITLNEWHHVTLAYTDDSDDEISLYVDGQLVKQSTDGAGSPAAESNDLLIGGQSTANYHGFIDDFKIYQKELTSSQIKSNYIKAAGYKGSNVAASIGSNESNLTNGLVGYWKMDENTGITTADASGNGKSLSFENSPTWGQGKYGQGITGNGTNSYLSSGVNDPDNLFDPLTGSFSAFVWVKAAYTSDGTSDLLFYKGGGGSSDTGWSIWIQQGTGRPLIYISDGSSLIVNGLTSTKVVADSTWHYVGFTWNPQEGIILYVDGIQVNSQSITSNANINSILPLYLGGHEIVNYTVNGSIDEARVYKRSLSPSEVSQLYNWAPGPIAQWQFDENTGTTSQDISGNGFTASLTNSTWTSGKFGSGIDIPSGNTHCVNANDTTGSVLDITNAITVEAWIYPETTFDTYTRVADKDYSTAWAFLARSSTSNYLSVWINNAERAYISSDLLTLNAWNHVAFTYNKDAGGTDEIKVYKDGILVGTGDYSTSIGTNNNYVAIGSNNVCNNTTNGVKKMDNVIIYNYARNSSQIIEDMSGKSSHTNASLGKAVGYWKFDEGYGDTANDSGISSSNGNLAGVNSCPGNAACPTWTNDGKFNKALSFDGGDYIDTASTPFNYSGDWTISAWVKRNLAGSSMSIVSKRGADGSGGYSIAVGGSGEIYCQTDNGTNVNSSSTITGILPASSAWTHIVGIRSGTYCDIYVNGINRTNTRVTHTTLATNSTSLRIGANTQGADYFSGTIDEVKVFNSALTSDQVKLLYNQNSAAVWGATSTDSSGNSDNSASRDYCVPGDTATCNTPLLEWKLDENTGTTAYDTSGNGYNGTLSQLTAADWSPGKYGSGLKFGDFTDDQLFKSNVAAFTQVPITVSVWVKFSQLASTLGQPQFIIGKDSSSAPYYSWSLRLETSNKIILKTANSTGTEYTLTGDNTLTTNTWYHINAVINSSYDAYLFINGIKQSTYSNMSSIFNATGNLDVGNWYLNGTVDQIKIYNYARTPAQIAWEYNHGEPVGWWKFDETSGTTAYDSSINRNNGTLNLPIWGAAKFNNGLTFDGNDSVNMSKPAALNLTNMGTIAVWFKASSVSNYNSPNLVGNCDWQNDRNGYCLALFSNSGLSIKAEASNASLQQSISSIRTDLGDNNWHQAVFTWDGSYLHIYVDGSENAIPEPQTINAVSGVYNVVVGADPAGNTTYNFTGQMDDVRIYNYALTAAQVKTLYNNSAVRF